MTIKNSLAGIAVNNFDAGVAWYSRLLERAPDWQLVDQRAEWRFPDGGSLQLFEDESRAGSSIVTLVESDVAARLEDLAKKGIMIITTCTDDAEKTAITSDPDGNQIVFSEPMDALKWPVSARP